MSLTIRPMQDGEEAAVATMVTSLAHDLNLPVKPQLTGERLRAAADIITVTVAEEQDLLLGACLALMTFSTWRGRRGMYVVDLFVDGSARNRNIGVKLLRAAARHMRARGAEFIKLEVDQTNTGGARFYERLGFGCHPEDNLFILEPDGFTRFIETED